MRQIPFFNKDDRTAFLVTSQDYKRLGRFPNIQAWIYVDSICLKKQEVDVSITVRQEPIHGDFLEVTVDTDNRNGFITLS